MAAERPTLGAVALTIALAACSPDRSPLVGGASGEDAVLLAASTAFAGHDCVTVEALATGFATTSPLRYHAMTYMLGQCLYRDGDYVGAIDVHGRLAHETPPRRYTDDALYFLGLARLHRDDPAGAAADFGEYAARFPHQRYLDDAYYQLGRARLALGEPQAALDAFATVLDLDGASDTRRAGATYRSGQAALDRADADAAEQATAWFDAVLADFPTSIYADNAAYALARLDYDLGAFAAAEAGLAAFAADWPESGLVHLARYFEGKAALAQGASARDRADALFADYEARWPAGAFADNSRYRRGRLRFDRASELDAAGSPDAPAAWDEARAMLESLLADYPETSLVAAGRYYLARVDYARGAWPTARDGFLAVLQAPPSAYHDNATYYVGRCLYRLASQLGASGYEQAIPWFERVASDFPGSSYGDDAAYFRARALTELGRLDAAAAAFVALLDAFPASSYRDNAWDRLIRVYLSQVDCPNASAALLAMRADVPDSPLLAAAEARVSLAGCDTGGSTP
ncbi:MAG: tetratricopeptide repeat protein [Deltaproteobacteria bacterium]|nr:MAG: tetratricopeptide repeat protein [Deltaproteobacteria bacterium]